MSSKTLVGMVGMVGMVGIVGRLVCLVGNLWAYHSACSSESGSTTANEVLEASASAFDFFFLIYCW